MNLRFFFFNDKHDHPLNQKHINGFPRNTGKVGVRDRLTEFSNPASGSFYFMPSVEVLDANC